MEMQGNENRLVPGQGRPLDLGKLKKLAYGKPPAAGRTLAASRPLSSPSAPRRIRRAGSAWAGALVLGSALIALGTLLFLDRGGPLRPLLQGNPAPVLPDAGLSPADKEKFWTSAGYESSRFASLMGVRTDDPARMEADALRLERLLSGRSPRP